MRISVDAHVIGCHLTGNETYIRNLLTEFARISEDDELIAYISKPQAPRFIPDRIQTRWVSENPYKRLGFDIPRLMVADLPDVLHVQYTAPLRCQVPVVVSLHDVSYLEHPEYFTRYRAAQLRFTVKRTVAMAARIITPSEFSRRAILEHYAVDPERVVVIHNGVSPRFRPVDREAARAAILKRYNISAPFVLTVGDLQPRKNLIGLLRAFADVIRAHPELPHHLVFAGKETWYSSQLHQAVRASGIADRVHFTGFVDDEDLVQFYGACDLFAFPSFYEGFGLPILEAMACGRAVVCSNLTAMPEVADSAAILFNPRSDAEMARAMTDVLIDAELRARLERLGQQHAAAFSWKRAAEQTLDVYYSAVGQRRELADPVKA